MLSPRTTTASPDFKTSRTFRRALSVLVTVAAVGLAGCGVSSTGVKAAQSTSTAVATTEATTTTTALVTTTTEEVTTTKAPATTTASGGGWPQSAKDQFLKSCEGGDDAKAPTCECALRAVEPEISIEQLLESGSTGSLPSDLEAKVTQAAQDCAVDPTSH